MAVGGGFVLIGWCFGMGCGNFLLGWCVFFWILKYKCFFWVVVGCYLLVDVWKFGVFLYMKLFGGSGEVWLFVVYGWWFWGYLGGLFGVVLVVLYFWLFVLWWVDLLVGVFGIILV